MNSHENGQCEEKLVSPDTETSLTFSNSCCRPFVRHFKFFAQANPSGTVEIKKKKKKHLYIAYKQKKVGLGREKQTSTKCSATKKGEWEIVSD